MNTISELITTHSRTKKMIYDTPLMVTYIGGPTAIIEIGGLRFMTDPTLDPSGSTYHNNITYEKTKGPAKADLKNIDIILLSHGQHIDNLDSAGRALLSHVTKTYTTLNSAKQLGGTSVGMLPWETDRVLAPDGTEIIITATPARHGPVGIEKMAGEVIGFLLLVKSGKGLQIYITGDTVYYEGVEEVAKRSYPKYVLVFAGAAQPIGPFNVTMDADDAVKTAFAFPKATIIPLHYEGWQHFTENENDIKRSFEKAGITKRLEILEAGITRNFNA